MLQKRQPETLSEFAHILGLVQLRTANRSDHEEDALHIIIREFKQ